MNTKFKLIYLEIKIRYRAFKLRRLLNKQPNPTISIERKEQPQPGKRCKPINIMSEKTKSTIRGKLSDASTCSVGLNLGPFGFVDDYNLECGTDGVMRVKGGRSLEEYINHPEMVEARSKGEINHQEWILIAASVYERGCIPHCA
jgi:hypothetical protein